MVAAGRPGRPRPLVLVPSRSMGPRTSIVAGLLAGMIAAVVLLAGVVALAPEPAIPSPTLAAPSPPPSASSVAATNLPSPVTSPGASPSSSRTALFHVGEPAPPLVVPQVGGGEIDLSMLGGKPVWINFMATWCPPCQDEFPLMEGFAARYAGNGLVVIAVDVKEEEGAVAGFAQSLGATFPLGLDRDGQAAQTWGAIALPVHFWIDADGIVRDGSLGGIGPDIMARGLESILPGVHVTP
jgi:cytochrome c biogenesis protein CcmG, thiol:disulfide interchange protein DsbE